jgi:glycosyltransferase involved in cell wall biosynthesis
MEIINKYQTCFAKIISEKDRGVYDAMNKGISHATGEYIGFLNSDDLYADEKVIALVAQAMETKHTDAYYADLVYVKSDDVNSIVRYWDSGIFNQENLKNGWIPPHPTFFVRREIYIKYGGFDLTYKLAADYELMSRYINKHAVRMTYIPKVLIKMRLGGMTNRSFKNIFTQNMEILRAAKANGISTSLLRLGVNKLLRRGLEFVNRPK